LPEPLRPGGGAGADIAAQPASPPSYSIVVPLHNKNRDRLLERCFESIEQAVRASSHPLEWIIVDNGSTDGSNITAMHYCPPGRLIRSSGRTISTVRNAGAAEALGTVLIFLDCDVLIPVDFIDRVEKVMADPAITATGSECSLPPEPSYLERVWHEFSSQPGDGPRRMIGAANFIVRRAEFDAIGGFNASFVTGEDTEICRALRDAGLSVVQSDSLAVAHLDNPRTLSGFARKMYWHGLGSLGAPGAHRLPRTAVATIAHVIAVLLALLVLTLPASLSVVQRAGGAALLALLPSIAMFVVRGLEQRRFGRPFATIMLLFVFLSARALALVAVLARSTGRKPADIPGAEVRERLP
jgi:hypothetical protein